MMKPFRALFLHVRMTRLLSVLGICLVLSCTTRSMRRVELLSGTMAKGDYREAIEQVRKSPKLYGNLNRFLYWFDLGVLFHYADEYDSSLVCLEKAELVLDELYAHSITNEAASFLTNDNVRPYRGRRYEQVLLHQMISFNYLAKNKPDEALVETRKLQLVFDRFAAKDRRAEKYDDDGMSHYLSSIVYDALGERDNASISLYKSVAAYTGGPIPLPREVGQVAYHRLIADGREEDVKRLHLNVDGTGLQPVGAQQDQTEIVLIGYAGRGPVLEETIFWGTYVIGGMLIGYYRNPYGDTVAVALPAPPLPESELQRLGRGEATSVGRTFHIKFALPAPVRRKSIVERFYVTSPTAAYSTSSTMINNTDLLLEKDIEDNYSATLLRTAVRVVLRTIAAQKTKEQLTTNAPVANLLFSIGTDVLADQLEKADTRLSFLLPQSIHITRIPVEPGTHRIEASAVDKNGKPVSSRVWDAVSVKKNKKVFLFYSAVM